MSKPRRQGMRQRVVPNNKADFSRKRLKWRRSEYTDRHKAVVSEKRERIEMERMRRQKEKAGVDREVSEKERAMADELRMLRKLMGVDT